MRAFRCTSVGPDPRAEVLEVEDPTPGPGEVLVRVAASAVNFPDVLLAQGRYQVQPPVPFTLGSELAGEVVAVGDGISAARTADSSGPVLGSKVVAQMLVGAFAELAVLPAASVTVLPDDVDLEKAAAFGVTFSTAFHALHTIGEVQPGQWVVVLGGAGGVGLAAIALARLAGARVIAAASSKQKLAACAAAGAEAGIDYTSQDLKSRIKELTGGGAHLVIDPVGGASSEQALRALRPGGKHVVVGYASGEIPRIATNLLLVKGISLNGLDMRAIHASSPAAITAANEVLYDHLAHGRLAPVIGARFSLADAAQALELVASRQAIGKVLVVP